MEKRRELETRGVYGCEEEMRGYKGRRKEKRRKVQMEERMGEEWRGEERREERTASSQQLEDEPWSYL